jgi:uncharacterized protein with von Willebrand factor type A (vWA) domain
VRPKLEYASSCVRRPFYGTHIDRIERVQKKFVRYALRGLGWTDMFDLPPYVNRCALIRLEILAERRANASVLFFFDILSGRVNSSNLLSLICMKVPWYQTWASNFLRVDFHRTNYGVHEPLNGAVHLSRNQFLIV